MNDDTGSHSVSTWIDDLKEGQDSAATELWNRYHARLVQVAYKRLRTASRRVADEEDVVVDAFHSFCRRAEDGKFPQLNDRDDLWHLLLAITERKALNQIRDQNRLKRGGGNVAGESVLDAREHSTAAAGINQISGGEPTPEFAALTTESFQTLFAMLGDEELRRIAQLKLEGHTNSDIASQIKRSLPTVERRLSLIRSKWSDESGDTE